MGERPTPAGRHRRAARCRLVATLAGVLAVSAAAQLRRRRRHAARHAGPLWPAVPRRPGTR